MTDDVRPGVELGLIIGAQARHLTPEKAPEYIAGYTVCRTLRADDQHPGLYGYRMFPGFLGVGPSIVPEIGSPVALGVRQGNETVDSSSTARLRFSLGDLVSYASHIFTLEPGDLIVTGNPVRTKDSVEAGETVTAWIESIGQQTTTLVAEEVDQ
jgi:2-keto-4-pentenoate hydratase/2-oxohepta-3-ene-1,7-dioic acid hydratase in catechol pathway